MPGKHNAGGCKCCQDDCGCQHGTRPPTLTLVIDGLMDIEPSDPVAESLNGTFILPNLASPLECLWELSWNIDYYLCQVPALASNILQVNIFPSGTTPTTLIVRAYLDVYLGCYSQCVPSRLGCRYDWSTLFYRYVQTFNECYVSCPECWPAKFPPPTEYQGSPIWLPCWTCNYDRHRFWFADYEVDRCDFGTINLTYDHDECLSPTCYCESLDFSSATFALTANS